MRQLLSARVIKALDQLILGKDLKVKTTVAGVDVTLGRKALLGDLVNKSRIKVVSGNVTLTEEDNGMTIILASASGATITVPTAVVNSMWRWRFVVLTAPTSGNYDIVTTGSSNTINGSASNAAGGAGTFASNADTIRFAQSQAVSGDVVDLTGTGVFGEVWTFTGQCRVAAGITSVQAS